MRISHLLGHSAKDQKHRTKGHHGRFALAVLTAIGIALPGLGHAQTDFPERPITIIVPFSAGGGTDLGARLLAADLEKELGSSVIVENRPGAGSQIGLTAIANAKPDGYTIGAVNFPATSTIILSPERKASFDIDSFSYLINHVVEPLIVAVKPDSPFNSLKDLIEHAKKNPGELRVGTSGMLTPEHLAQLQFEQAADSRLRIAHFNGAADSMTQFRGGRTDIAFTTPSFIEGLKPLAILSEQRSKALPDLPTAVEQGYPNMVMISSRGFAVPKGTPEPVLKKLQDVFAKVASSPAHIENAADKKLTVEVISGEDYEAFVRKNHEEARKLLELSAKRD
jgi:tripartite-type tricarboxylate transporter receptor subunit TctC